MEEFEKITWIFRSPVRTQYKVLPDIQPLHQKPGFHGDQHIRCCIFLVFFKDLAL